MRIALLLVVTVAVARSGDEIDARRRHPRQQMLIRAAVGAFEHAAARRPGRFGIFGDGRHSERVEKVLLAAPGVRRDEVEASVGARHVHELGVPQVGVAEDPRPVLLEAVIHWRRGVWGRRRRDGLEAPHLRDLRR